MRSRLITGSMLWLSGLVLMAMPCAWPQAVSLKTEAANPSLDSILTRMEDVQRQNPAHVEAHEVTREYKVFHGDDPRAISEVVAQIDFVPPDLKTYRIVEARGKSRGEKMVRELLDRETDSAKKLQEGSITRANYDFVLLRRQNFGLVPEYVMAIFPKRKDKFLLRGEIWVDARTFRIRRIEGIPAKSPSFWLREIHITVQFAQVRGMFLPVTFDAVASVLFFGKYTLAGANIRDIPMAGHAAAGNPVGGTEKR